MKQQDKKSIETQKLWEKAQALTKKLTLDEKISMVHGAELFQTGGVKRLSIPPLKMSDGPMGVRQEFKPSSWQAVGQSDDYVTYLPCNSALASTWNRELAYDTGSVLGEEARGRGKDVILAPGVNIKRSPLCGRNFEYFSEDPYLTKELAVPFIRGVQEWDVAACVKHFALNNQETERIAVEAEADDTAIENIYLPAFYDAVTRGGSDTIMGAYNKIKGEYCCQSDYLLNEILRKKWGYDGVIISDWGAVHDTKKAAASEVDIEMSVTDNFDDYFMAQPLKKQIEAGEIEEKRLDEKVTRILALMMRLHMLEGNRKTGTYNTKEHWERTLNIARESVILLKNEEKNGVKKLPLCAEKMKKILVIGENAECTHANGGGSAEIKALYEITPLMGIKTFLGGNVQVDFILGYCRDESQEQSGTNWQETSLEGGGGRTKQQSFDEKMHEKRAVLQKEVLEKAAACTDAYDAIIFIGGLNHEQDREGNDRADMKLPYEQDELIAGLLEIRPDSILAFVGGSPVEMGGWIDKADSVVWSWYAGMEGGRALAEVLFGAVNPSGKLPETFYKKHTDCSAHAIGEFPGEKVVRYKESVFVGYRYNDTYHVEPQFCFGHGLSYTGYRYENAQVKKEGKMAVVSIDVTNIGSCAGKEIVQIYLEPKNRKENQPLRELKGFEKISLEAGEKKTAFIEIEGWDETFKICIGKSSREICLTL